MEGRPRFGRFIDEGTPSVMEKKLEARIRQMLRSYYELIDSNTVSEHESRGKINGFCEALVLTRQTDAENIRALFDEVHLDFFGMTKEARHYQVSGSDHLWSQHNWTKFDRPAYTRRPRRCGRK